MTGGFEVLAFRFFLIRLRERAGFWRRFAGTRDVVLPRVVIRAERRGVVVRLVAMFPL